MRVPSRRKPTPRARRRAVPPPLPVVEAEGPGLRSFRPVEITLILNGRKTVVSADPSRTLLEFLRYDCGLTGTKEGCSKGECGACTVLMNDRPVNACLVMARQAEGAEIVTIEGLAARWAKRRGKTDASLHPVQRGFIEKGGAQCGICTPGFIMAAAALLERHPNPSHDELIKGLEGNLCRCTGYLKIFESVRRGAELMREE